MKADFFNEAIITAMLAASSHSEEGGDSHEELLHPDMLRERLILLLDQARRAAVQEGMPPELAEAADFAVCAFIDEVLLSSTLWTGRLNWLKKPLQLQRHSTATAGEDFYALLNSLLEQAAGKAPVAGPGGAGQEENANREYGAIVAVLEIFALCLTQGFTGMHYANLDAIDAQLDKIGRFVPALGRSGKISLPKPEAAQGAKSLSRGGELLRRFDILDIALWVAPLLITLLIYHACRSRLDELLHAFLQGVQ